MLKEKRRIFKLCLTILLIVSIVNFGQADLFSMEATTVSAATNSIKGVNWADPNDNFNTGVLYLSGLSSTDTYASAATVADRVIGQFMSLLGSNTVRMPINEATVSSYWGTYTGAIDTALSKGKVILCYWAAANGKPSNMTNYWNMWNTVVNKYGSNSNCYFEPINEPYGYSASDLCTVYRTWVSNYASVPKGRIILDGSGYAENLSTVGADSNLSSCLLGVHDYAFWKTLSSEGAWQQDIANIIGSYASRVVVTEWGAAMTTGKNYNQPSTDNEVCYIRGLSNQLRAMGVGSCYWPGLRDGDSYRLTTKSGSGSSITLSVTNTSGLDRLKYAWGDANIKIKNAATNMYLDGNGATSNGADTLQINSANNTKQQWVIEGTGSTYVRIKNAATGLYLDGLGNSSNGATAGQWGNTNSVNQQWTQEVSGNYVMFKNRGTGLYLDGLGYTTNGSVVGQWSKSGSSNQKWSVTP
ncbi:hypothetical protein HNQ56_001808 [Anaerotaenia torta]|uniref:RICIN domain-containing protein n=1 Tax=Anaerotaenia torta TaxID=433293 RepID=UPI003D20F643